MSEELHAKTFRIISLTEGNPPIGVNHTRPAFQFIYANAPVQDWEFRKDEHDGNKYHLKINGYPYTGVIDGKVIASIHHEHDAKWEFIHRERQHAYTIALADEPHLGWTLPLALKDNKEVELKPIIMQPSEPPQFIATQLFTLRSSE